MGYVALLTAVEDHLYGSSGLERTPLTSEAFHMASLSRAKGL